MNSSDLDHVDQILDEWRRACPAVDASPVAITGRVTRIALYSERDAERHLERHRLTRSGFDVLNALRGSPGHRLSPTQLARAQRMSSAGITGLVDQLAASQLVVRSAESHDRRRVLVSLTRRGSELTVEAGAGWFARVIGKPCDRRRRSSVRSTAPRWNISIIGPGCQRGD